MKVYINPGHAPNGVPDPGAVNPNNGARESDFTWAAGQMLQAYLEQAGMETRLLQSDNLNEVCQASNAWQADIFVSLHCNSAADLSAQGMETWYASPAGLRLANCIQRQLASSLDTTDRGCKHGPGLWVLKDTDAVAVLVEMGFIGNDHDYNLLASRLDSIAAAIARGVTDYELEVSRCADC